MFCQTCLLKQGRPPQLVEDQGERALPRLYLTMSYKISIPGPKRMSANEPAQVFPFDASSGVQLLVDKTMVLSGSIWYYLRAGYVRGTNFMELLKTDRCVIIMGGYQYGYGIGYARVR